MASGHLLCWFTGTQWDLRVEAGAANGPSATVRTGQGEGQVKDPVPTVEQARRGQGLVNELTLSVF